MSCGRRMTMVTAVVAWACGAASGQVVTAWIGDNDGFGVDIPDGGLLEAPLPISINFDIDPDGFDEATGGLALAPDFATGVNVFEFGSLPATLTGGTLTADFAALVGPADFLGAPINSIALVDNGAAGMLELTDQFFPISQGSLETGWVTISVDPTFLSAALVDSVVGLATSFSPDFTGITDAEDGMFAVDFFSLTAIPEPQSAGLLTCGGLVLAAWHTRRRR